MRSKAIKYQIYGMLLFGLCGLSGVRAMDSSNNAQEKKTTVAASAFIVQMRALWNRAVHSSVLYQEAVEYQYEKYLHRSQAVAHDDVKNDAFFQEMTRKLININAMSDPVLLVKTYPKTVASTISLVVAAALPATAYFCNKAIEQYKKRDDIETDDEQEEPHSDPEKFVCPYCMNHSP